MVDEHLLASTPGTLIGDGDSYWNITSEIQTVVVFRDRCSRLLLSGTSEKFTIITQENGTEKRTELAAVRNVLSLQYYWKGIVWCMHLFSGSVSSGSRHGEKQEQY